MSDTEKRLLDALKGMLKAYAPHVENTVNAHGDGCLHSAVREARDAIIQAETKARIVSDLQNKRLKLNGKTVQVTIPED